MGLHKYNEILLAPRARLDRLVALILDNFTMEGSLNVNRFDKSLLFSISFTMEGSLLGNRS